jgi:exocyst complex component 4
LQVPRKENVAKFANNLDISSSKPNRGLAQLDNPAPISNIHPESDSFTYIKHIVLALRSLSQSHRAMDTLTQRLPLEVYQLVDKTIIEVENRHSLDLRNLGNRRREQRGFNFGKSEASADVLADLLWTLYSKLAAVLGGHRIVHDCVLAIVKESKSNDNLVDTPEFNYIEVWKPIQSEVYPPLHRRVVDGRYDRYSWIT